MSQGQGSFQTNPKPQPQAPPGPPFLLTSADNGLSVDPISGKIVLGQNIGQIGDPAQLLNDREIPLNLFQLHILERTQGVADYLQINPASSNILLGANDNNASALLTMQGQVAGGASMNLLLSQPTGENSNITALAGSGGATVDMTRTVNDLVHSWQESINTWPGTNYWYRQVIDGNVWFQLDIQNNAALLIVPTPAPNFANVALDGANRSFIIGTGDGTASAFYEGQANGAALQVDAAADDGAGNDARLLLDALNAVASIFTDNAGKLTIAGIDGLNGIWRAFSDGNGTFLRMSDFNQQVEAGNDNGGGTVIHYLQLNKIAKTYAIGDIDGADTGTTLTVNDTTEKFVLDNTAHTSIVRINGVDGFTGTVTPVTSVTVNGGIVTNVT